MEKVVFLDRDGVINIEKNYLYKIEDFEFIDGVFKALSYLQNLGYKLIIITNQSGIGRGYYTKEQYDELTIWMVKQFKLNHIEISSVFCCPHSPTDDCECRKPKIGMITQATEIIDIDYKNSWLIGDKESDIQAGLNAKVGTNILFSNKFIDNNFKNNEDTILIKNFSDILVYIKKKKL